MLHTAFTTLRMNCYYTAHIDFIQVYGQYVPWCVYFVDTRQLDRRFVILLDTGKILFTHQDLLFNHKVDDFPRITNRFDKSQYFWTCLDLLGIKEHIKKLYFEHWTNDEDGWDIPIGATDKYTFKYLDKIIPNVILLPKIICSEIMTVSAAANIKEERDRKMGRLESDV